MLLRQGTERIEVVVRKEGGGSVKGANETAADEKTAGGAQETLCKSRTETLFFFLKADS